MPLLRKPLTTLALEYVSGSAQACLGSTQYDQCVDVYLLDAVPSAHGFRPCWPGSVVCV